MDILSVVFSINSKKAIFETLFKSEMPEYYLRELERVTGIEYKSLHNEILKLVDADLVCSRKDGNRNYFSANSEHPIFSELCSIVEKTSGIAFMLTELLKNEEVDVAFIFGSMAKGKAKSHSDVDLFIVGEIRLRKLASLLSPLEEKIGREINPHIYSQDALKEKLLDNNHFIKSMITTDKNYIIGNESDFRKVCKV